MYDTSNNYLPHNHIKKNGWIETLWSTDIAVGGCVPISDTYRCRTRVRHRYDMCQMQVVVSQKEKQRHGSDTAKTRFGDTAEKQNDLTPKKKQQNFGLLSQRLLYKKNQNPRIASNWSFSSFHSASHRAFFWIWIWTATTVTTLSHSLTSEIYLFAGMIWINLL